MEPRKVVSRKIAADIYVLCLKSRTVGEGSETAYNNKVNLAANEPAYEVV